jgi:hypothetical protein
MSDLAYFEYKTIIPPQGSEREGTPAHYLVDVLTTRIKNRRPVVRGILTRHLCSEQSSGLRLPSRPITIRRADLVLRIKHPVTGEKREEAELKKTCQ